MISGSAASTPQTLLSSYTTLRVGGPARRMVRAHDEAALLQAVQAADAQGEPLLLIGGGSNLLIADDGFPGTVVLIGGGPREPEIVGEGDGHVDVRVAAGHPWDDLVALTVGRGWAGLEALSGIPGLAGATPVQNVGAYGARSEERRVGSESAGGRSREHEIV